MTRTRNRIDNEVFIYAYQTSDSYEEVAQRLSQQLSKTVSVQVVQSKVAYLRKHGVKLKKMPRPRLDVNKLNLAANKALEES